VYKAIIDLWDAKQDIDIASCGYPGSEARRLCFDGFDEINTFLGGWFCYITPDRFNLPVRNGSLRDINDFGCICDSVRC
jgi:hypothetical protein